jgi:hypothetical protein
MAYEFLTLRAGNDTQPWVGFEREAFGSLSGDSDEVCLPFWPKFDDLNTWNFQEDVVLKPTGLVGATDLGEAEKAKVTKGKVSLVCTRIHLGNLWARKRQWEQKLYYLDGYDCRFQIPQSLTYLQNRKDDPFPNPRHDQKTMLLRMQAE